MTRIIRTFGRPLLVGLLSLPVLVGCVANSDRSYRGQVVDAADPWPSLRTCWEGLENAGGEIDRESLRTGLQQLEDIVEGAASVVYGADVDFPTPTVFAREQVVFLTDRHSPTGAIGSFLAAQWLSDANPLALKYVFDHIGHRELEDFTAEERRRLLDLCDAVDEYLSGELSLDAARASLSSLEALAFAPLGMTERQLLANEERYDSSLWIRSGFTAPAGMLKRVRLNLAQEDLWAGDLEPIFLYAHELHHALVLRAQATDSTVQKLDQLRRINPAGGGRGEERVALHELSAQVFAQRVVREIQASGLLGEGLLDGAADAGIWDAKPIEAATGEDPLVRLRALYRGAQAQVSAAESPSRNLVEARYGYTDQASRLELIEFAMDSLGMLAFTALLPRIESFQDLRSLCPPQARSTSP
ncbi:MAG: hypothetical protein ACI9K5_002970 [Gammaproteobacteria bacterium]|jgi:hypothetical protein